MEAIGVSGGIAKRLELLDIPQAVWVRLHSDTQATYRSNYWEDSSEHKRDILMKETVTKQTEQPTNTPLDSIDETTYLLRSPANAEHLNKSITQFKMGNVFKKQPIEE